MEVRVLSCPLDSLLVYARSSLVASHMGIYTFCIYGFILLLYSY